MSQLITDLSQPPLNPLDALIAQIGCSRCACDRAFSKCPTVPTDPGRLTRNEQGVYRRPLVGVVLGGPGYYLRVSPATATQHPASLTGRF